MDLWVRSQDKKFLAKVDNIFCINNTLFYDHHENKANLGTYATKERALEVLDEIQNILNPMIVFKNCNCTKDMLDKIKEVGACVVSDNSHIEQLSTCVYKMPKE